jgi:transcriptional regulator with XRE-family HTH domain
MKTTSLNPHQISQARARSGLSRAEVAYRLRQRGHKANENSLRRWESGAHAPHANIIPDLAAVLGVTIEKLYERSESGDDDDEEADETVRRLRLVASQLATRDLDDLAAELLTIAGLVARQEGAPR